MARIRTIKPEFWTSETIARLDLLDRLLFIGLWNYADDEGRGKDNPALVRAAVFPLDETVSLQRIHEGLRSLQSAGLIVRYRVDGKAYFALPSWTEHQKVSHPAESKFPAPDQAQEDSGEPPEDLLKVTEILAPERNRERNREQGKEHSPQADGFEEFWQQYPKRGGKRDGKANAQKLWSKLSPAVRAEALAGLPLYAESKGEFPEDAERYIRNKRWIGLEPVEPPPPPPAVFVKEYIPGPKATREQFDIGLTALRAMRRG